MANLPDPPLESDLQPAHAELAASPCLSDEDVLAFAIGRWPEARLARAHEHLDQCETCQRLLSEAAHALATAATTPRDDSDDLSWNTTFQPGTLVGQRYLIRQFIARGGMGEVYEAFDNELQERVALKTVTSTACDNPNAVRRLKGEVQLARRVGHPNVCRIYDFGTHVMTQTGAQISFLTMEFVDGETLGQRVRLCGALPVEEARKLGRQLLLGLSAAHEAGVLHRDFKSDNVMLRAEAGDESSPLILDFGLARALDQRHASHSNPTLVGTFGYIAPEQLEGKPYSTASDVYALGIVWFEMLTGELPFESSSSPAIAALERLQKAAPSPSSKNPLVPPDLDAIVGGCLRRSPKDRFRTPAAVLAALDALERQTRSRFQKRLMPLALAAGLGGVVAFAVLTVPPKKPAQLATVGSLSPALPAPQGINERHASTVKTEAAETEPLKREPLKHEPNTPEPNTRGPSAAVAPGKPQPEPEQARQQPAPAAKPSKPSPDGFAAFPETATTAATNTAAASAAPTSTAPRASPKRPGWENPFGTSTPAELLVDAQHN
jgi:serine/threonine protein kinase